MLPRDRLRHTPDYIYKTFIRINFAGTNRQDSANIFGEISVSLQQTVTNRYQP